jgi:hypothetical protein
VAEQEPLVGGLHGVGTYVCVGPGYPDCHHALQRYAEGGPVQLVLLGEIEGTGQETNCGVPGSEEYAWGFGNQGWVLDGEDAVVTECVLAFGRSISFPDGGYVRHNGLTLKQQVRSDLPVANGCVTTRSDVLQRIQASKERVPNRPASETHPWPDEGVTRGEPFCPTTTRRILDAGNLGDGPRLDDAGR